VVSAADLPKSRYAGSNGAIKTKVPTIFGDFGLDDRARSDNAHLAAQNIEQLRQFIKARPSQETAEPRHAGIALQLMVSSPFRRGVWIGNNVIGENTIAIDVHASEFVQHEGCAVLTDSALSKNDRPPAFEAHSDGDQYEGRQKGDQGR
jgi:hypothetical protein